MIVSAFVDIGKRPRRPGFWPQNRPSGIPRELETRMNIKPLHDRIVIKRFEAETKTTGGILLPDSAQNKPQKGKVLAVGPGKTLKDGSVRPLQIKPGDTVVFTNWAGDEFKESHGQNILLMREEDVLAVLVD
jgi:chaperonin GroES